MLAGVSQSVLLYLGALRASGQLHNFLLQQILRCPMSFFDITPAGRILNRFSKDMQGLDEEVANCLQDWFLCVLEAAGVIFIVTYSTRVAIVALVPLCCIYIVIQVQKQKNWKKYHKKCFFLFSHLEITVLNFFFMKA